MDVCKYLSFYMTNSVKTHLTSGCFVLVSCVFLNIDAVFMGTLKKLFPRMKINYTEFFLK